MTVTPNASEPPAAAVNDEPKPEEPLPEKQDIDEGGAKPRTSKTVLDHQPSSGASEDDDGKKHILKVSPRLFVMHEDMKCDSWK